MKPSVTYQTCPNSIHVWNWKEFARLYIMHKNIGSNLIIESFVKRLSEDKLREHRSMERRFMMNGDKYDVSMISYNGK